MIRLFKQFISKSKADRLVILKILYLSGKYRFLLQRGQFERLVNKISEMGLESNDMVSQADQMIAFKIRNYVNAVSKRTPWESKCLVKALISQELLNAYGISSTLYLGLKKTGDQLEAHAWLRVGEVVILGEDVMHEYNVINKFRSKLPINC